jgi:hypothetical protein
MKQMTLLKMLLAAFAVMLTTAIAQQSTTTTTTTNPVTGRTTTESTTVTSQGTILGYTPASDYVTFRTTTDAAPVRYYYTKDTTILDPEGRVVTWSAIRPRIACNSLLRAGRRSHDRAQDRLESAGHGLREERNHHDNYNSAAISSAGRVNGE